MSYTHDSADVHIARMAETNIVDAEAIGGSRRRRAALISAAMRRECPGAVRLHVSYSETYGFQAATYARYRVAVVGPECPVCGERVEVGRPQSHGRPWQSTADPARLQHRHVDGEPLCPVMTGTGYQPALPVRRA